MPSGIRGGAPENRASRALAALQRVQNARAHGAAIAGFTVAPATGVLTPLPGSPFDSGGGFPTGYATDSAGRLFSVNIAAGQVRVFTTAAGVPTGVTNNPFASGLTTGVHGVLHPGGFYLVADRNGNQVGVYRIAGSGAATTLAPVTGSPFAAGGASTNVLALTGDGTFLVAANGTSRNLTAFRVDAMTGGLTSVGTQPANTLGTTDVITGLAFVPEALLISTGTGPGGRPHVKLFSSTARRPRRRRSGADSSPTRPASRAASRPPSSRSARISTSSRASAPAGGRTSSSSR